MYPLGTNSYPLGTNSYPLGMNSYPLGTNSYPVMDQPVFWGLLCSRGSDRLTSTAQPGLGGKRSDSSKVGVTSAVTELMQAIDREPNNLIEKKINIQLQKALTAQAGLWEQEHSHLLLSDSINMNGYVGLCHIAFITLMAIILVCDVNMNGYVGLCCITFITLMAIINLGV